MPLMGKMPARWIVFLFPDSFLSALARLQRCWKRPIRSAHFYAVLPLFTLQLLRMDGDADKLKEGTQKVDA